MWEDGSMSDVHGTQVVRRVGAILRAVGSTGLEGITASDLAAEVGLSRSTVHRLLTALAVEGFLDHEGSRWRTGPELYLLGAASSPRYNVRGVALPTVLELAELSGESAFFSARRGVESICLIREDGSFPVRSFVLHEGVRFPLGVASAGLAILSFESDAWIDDYLATADLETRFGEPHSASAIRERIRATRETGYAVNPGLIVEGSWGMGAAVFDAAGEPQWALSLNGIESRFRPERQEELGRMLVEHAHALSRELINWHS
jgi:DNA-binding IclR family transcriptional regulator